MPAIDKVLFATFCQMQGNFCGVNPHYLAAVAQLRSQINDDVVEGRIGPFRFTQEEWDKNRKSGEFKPDFKSSHVNSWRMQCSNFARMTHDTLEKCKAQNAGQMPSALDLYIAQLAADGVPVVDDAQKEKIAEDLQNALRDTKAAIVRAEAEALDDASMPAGADTTPGTILFRRVPGLALVKGHLIAAMQSALIQRGHLSATTAAGLSNKDGVFGSGTENALEAWQAASGHPSTGALTHGQWRELTGLPTPSIYERCAQITAAFEGTGFGGTNATDFDNTILTFGYHGYTLTGGNLQVFMQEMDAKHPTLLDQSFGAAKAAELRTLFPPVPLAQAKTRGRALFLSGNNIKEDWRDAFKVFGETSECQIGQLDFSHRVYWSVAEKMRAILKLSEPLSHALCFDVAVQNGDKSIVAKNTAAAFTDAMGEPERRVRFGEEIAKASLPTFQNDVRKRKADALGKGVGVVHGGEYHLVNWGFATSESAEANDGSDSPFTPSDNATFNAFFADQFPGLTVFSASEFLVKGAKHASNHLNTDPPQVLWPNIVKTVRVLVELKKRLNGASITLNSAYRSRAYNESVGGARDSQHMKFTAVDLVAHDGRSPKHWAGVLHQMRNEGFFLGGIGEYNSFVHVDTRGHNADWG